MHGRSILRIFGILLMVFSISNLPPLAVSIILQDGQEAVWVEALAITLFFGWILWLPVRRYRGELRTRDGFVITTLFWLVLGAAGALPFYLSDTVVLSITDSFFESFSGLTTTGATVISGLDTLPASILWYRQQLQWLGGLGIVVLAVAILPMLGIGGMQLYRTETPGPVKDSKITPRIAGTAKALWLIYVFFTAACALAYWLAGMTPFNAILHAFSTIAIGGFSPHDASLGHYDSVAIELIAVLFMLLAAANFALHFSLWRNRSVKHYFRDPEYRFFLGSICFVVFITVLFLLIESTYESPWQALRYGLFTAVSNHTTTGFGVTDFTAWPHMLPYLLILAAFIGGCAGSTAGGMKAMRILLLWKQGTREIKKLIHPNGIFRIKVGGRPLNENVVNSVWGFFAVYVVVFATVFFVLLTLGIDFETTWSVTSSALNNLGPALGDASSNWASLNDAAKWLLCFAMLLGRLEIFTLLVLFSPYFWRS